MKFEWDKIKDQMNREKHGVSFEQARSIFYRHFFSAADNRKNYGEVRLNALGLADNEGVLYVTYTMRGESLRIISARRASAKERNFFSLWLDGSV